VRADDGVPDGVALPQLDLDPLAQRREHLGEDDLLRDMVSISSTFYEQLYARISKKQKKDTDDLSVICAFGICEHECCLLNVGEIYTRSWFKLLKHLCTWFCAFLKYLD